MKKIVLTFGLISGAITALMMFVTQPLIGHVSFDKLEIVGYTTIVVSFLMVFFGIRSYRETVGGGRISFGQAFKVGLLITLISCACYVLAWEIVYYKIAPDFVDKYGSYMLEKARASGATPEELATERQRMETFKEWYKNPLINVAITLMEPLPIGVLITLISSLILRRREPKAEVSEVKV
jgi:Protein of unknown function (DUF4199)